MAYCTAETLCMTNLGTRNTHSPTSLLFKRSAAAHTPAIVVNVYCSSNRRIFIWGGEPQILSVGTRASAGIERPRHLMFAGIFAHNMTGNHRPETFALTGACRLISTPQDDFSTRLPFVR
eukprot:scaffold5605_cov128-Cylindrotheca_fusiformis.AAC.23